MSWTKFGLLFVACVVVVFLLLSVIPGGTSIQNAGLRIVQWCLNATRFVALLLLLFFGAFFGGLVLRTRIFNEFVDSRIDTGREMNGLQHFFISLLVGVLFAALQVVVTGIVLRDSQDIHWLFSRIGLGGPFETPSVIFIVFGFFTSVWGYLVTSNE